MPQKRLVNNNPVNLIVTLFVRSGPEPGNYVPSAQFFVAAHQEAIATYGNAENRFLDGLEVMAGMGALGTDRRTVEGLGSPLDTLLNTNNTLTFNSLDLSALHGSNS